MRLRGTVSFVSYRWVKHSVICAALAAGLWLSPAPVHALGSCGSGGLTGERERVDFEGSLYYVTTPADYDASREWPLILGLHGDEGDPANSVNWNWRTVPDGRFIFVAPKATNESGSWYMASDDNAAWMDSLLESLLSQYNVDLDRIYIWGLSGGAEFISGYALGRQDVFAAAQWNMGGNSWGWRSAGSPSPDSCKLPARFVVSTTDFLRDGAMSLFEALTDAGHETVWLDADCEGHCWDDVESGVGARDWLLERTFCGMTRAPGCDGDPMPPMESDPIPPMDPVDPGVEDPVTPPADAPQAGDPSDTPSGNAGGAAPVPGAPVPEPQTPPTMPVVPPPATIPIMPTGTSDGGGSVEGSGCAVQPSTGNDAPAWVLALLLGVWPLSRRRRAHRAT